MKFSLDTSIPIQFDELEPFSDQRFVRGKIWICHTGENRNRSSFSKEVLTNAIPSLANIPVLGFIKVDNTNEIDFAGHEQRIVIDKDGARIEYLGRMYGIVPETNNAKFETKICDDGIEREFLTAEVLLHTKFKECIDIVQREGLHHHSMELFPDSIQGKFNSKGIFDFTSFLFEGLCLLGEDVTPAMINSSLELFSQFNYNNQLKEMLQEFNLKFSHLLNSEEVQKSDNILTIEPNQGGKKVDEKMELFAKFPTLKEEDVEQLKTNIEQYTLEELEEKLNQLSAQSNTEQKKVTTEFSLTSQQLKDELRLKLSEHQHIDRWGDSCRQYWYVDHDDERVYAEDGQNAYLPVGINYSLNGDTVALNMESKKRIKWVPQDLEDNSNSVSTLMSVERSENDFNKIDGEFKEFKQSSESKYTELEIKLTEKDNLFTSLQKEFDEVNSKFEEVNEKYTAKLEKETEEKFTSLFDNFAKELSVEELSEVKNLKSQLSYDEIETRLFALVGKKKAKFSHEPKKNPIIDIETEKPKRAKTGKSYDELFEKYGQ